MAATEPLWLGTTDKYARLRQIEALDLETQNREIVGLFFSDFRSAIMPLALAELLMTYSAPRISRILAETGELEHRVAKRVVDTALLTRAVTMHGLRESPGREAARRVNAMHSRYDIHDDDFIAVGADTALAAIGLAEKFGWRPVTDKEREAIRLHYATITRAFGGGKPFPESVPAMQRFWDQYAATQLGFEPQNKRMAEATLKWFASLAPALARPFYRIMMLSIIDPRILRACGLRLPSAPERWAAHAVLRKIGRSDPLPDGTPDGLEDLVRMVYPNGYEIDQLGTHAKAA